MFSSYGVIVYVMVPAAIINGNVGFAFTILQIIMVSVMLGLVLILQFLIAPLSHFLLESKYYIYKLFGSSKGS